MKTALRILPCCLVATVLYSPQSILASITEYQAAVKSEASLISYYTFDAGNANDAQAANNGTVVGSATYGPGGGGGTDKAIVLDGTGYVNLGQVDAFDFISGYGTVEAWVRADWTSSPGYNPAIFADRDGGPVNWSVHMEASKAGAGLWNGSSYQPLAIAGTGTTWPWCSISTRTSARTPSRCTGTAFPPASRSKPSAQTLRPRPSWDPLRRADRNAGSARSTKSRFTATRFRRRRS